MADRPQAEANGASATAPAVAEASATTAEGNVATATDDKAADPAEAKADTVDEKPEGDEKTEGSAAVTTEENGSSAPAAEENGSSAPTVAENGNSATTKATPAPEAVKVKSPRRKRTPFRQLPLTQKLWIAGGCIAVVALVVAGIFTWQATTTGEKVLTQVAGTSMAKDPHNPNLIDYTDPGTKFKLSFPASWATRDIGGSDVRLLAGPGNGDLMSVRVDTLDTGSSAAPTQDSLEPYLNAIVQGDGVKIITRDKIQMGNLPGWYYVYTFTDSSSKQEGIHAQYFIIRGNQLYSIVFQALPLNDFHKLATTYQQVANSIRFY